MSEPAPIQLALFEPDIAQNTGAMMRTCACFGVDVAIIEPAGFRMSDSRFRRAGMDYLHALTVSTHNSWARFAAWRAFSQRRLVLLTTKGEACLWDFAFREGDIILVGRELAGVPEAVMASAEVRVRIPIGRRCVRSMWGSQRLSPCRKRCANFAACRPSRNARVDLLPNRKAVGVTTTGRSAIVASMRRRKR